LQTVEVKDTMNRQGLVVAGGKPDRLQSLVKDELARWVRVVDTAGIQADK
jgi:tripartite-type tricarboxylate transporter receptor subunit TctC